MAITIQAFSRLDENARIQENTTGGQFANYSTQGGNYSIIPGALVLPAEPSLDRFGDAAYRCCGAWPQNA